MKFIGLENYVRMFQDETFREAVVNNLKFVVLGSLFQLCAGLILAILLTHISKGGNILRVIYFIPCIISSMAICQIFSKMLSVQPQGLVCYVMENWEWTYRFAGKFPYSADYHNPDRWI